MTKFVVIPKIPHNPFREIYQIGQNVWDMFQTYPKHWVSVVRELVIVVISRTHKIYFIWTLKTSMQDRLNGDKSNNLIPDQIANPQLHTTYHIENLIYKLNISHQMHTLNHEKTNNLIPDQVANPQLDSPLTQLQIDAGIVVLENQQVDHRGLKEKRKSIVTISKDL